MKQHMNRILSAILALMLCVGLLVVGATPAFAAEGTCGDNLTWTLHNGILTISGAGEMMDFPESSPAPWLEYADQIQCVKISDGITKIGNYAFYHCINLTTVSLPASVKSLGKLAFAGCYNMMQIGLPAVEEIGSGCFYDCTAIKAIGLPNTLKAIGNKAFYHCSSLAGIIIPASVETFGNSVFCYSENLVYVKFECQLPILPYWTFYGCDRLTELYLPSSVETVESGALSECPNLNYVSYNGSQEVEEEIDKQLAEETQKQPTDISGTTITFDQTEDGSVIVKTETGTSASIDATINDVDGWDELVDSILGATNKDPAPTVEVQLGDNQTLPEGALGDLANKNVTITIQTPDNVDWEVVMSDQTSETLSTAQNFRVSFTRNSKYVYTNFIGNAVSYTITLESTGLNSTVYLPLGIETARQVASLYQINGDKLELLCSVIIDDQGKAAFPLAGTTPGKYILALNVQGIDSSEVRIPQKLAGDYGDGTLMDIYGNKYIVTGVTNPLGFGVGTLTLIIVGVLVGSALIVGAVMTMWNKQRKKAYAGMHAEQSNQEASPDSGTRKRNTRFFVRQSEGNASGKAPENAENEEIASTLEEKSRRRRENSANNGRMKFHRKKR